MKDEQSIKNWMHMLLHDLRGPIANSIGLSDYLLGEEVSPEENRDFLILINNNGKKLLKMIEDYLIFEKVENGHKSIKKNSVSVIQLMEEVKKTFFELRSYKKLSTSFKKQATDLMDVRFLQKEILINDSLFLSLLMNLLRNAVEASPEKESEIQVCIYEDDELLCISFTNQGEVPGEIKSKLFNKFGTSKKTGTGLGLYGAKLIIEAHGGTIDYEPLEGGTRFIVRIPFA